uniref:ANK_REP_REGION domain-containing protein n=3 Tax=Macrostomum lignano TaxID=282301 RepID=A0A1I8H3D4_9PLAT
PAKPAASGTRGGRGVGAAAPAAAARGARPAATRGRGGASGAARGGGGSRGGTAAKQPQKAKPQPAKSVADPRQSKAALTIQCWYRRLLAARKLAALRAARQDYERQMERLEKEAFVAVVRMQQAAAERQRAKEEEERKRRAEQLRRRKRMLEAAFNGETEEMESLLREQESLDSQAGLSRDDPIGRALRNRHQLELLDCEDANGNSPLSEAASGGDPESVGFLLQRGADPNRRGQFGRTPLYRASFAGHLAACEQLLGAGADPRIYAEDAQTARDVAAIDEVRELLDSWDIGQTDQLLGKIEKAKAARREEERKRQEAEMASLDAQVEAAERESATAELRLRQAHCDLEKRIHEHDLAAGEGRTDVAPATLASVHDAEAELELAKAGQERARDRLSMLRLQRREKAAENQEGKSAGDESRPGIRANVRELDDILLRDVGNRIQDSNRWPLLVDPSGMACTFLRYRDTNYANALNPADMEVNKLRMAVMGALRFGKPFVLDLMDLDHLLDSSCAVRFGEICPNLLQMLIDKSILKDANWRRLVRPGDSAEYGENRAWRLEHFRFMVVTKNSLPDPKYLDQFLPVWVVSPS